MKHIPISAETTANRYIGAYTLANEAILVLVAVHLFWPTVGTWLNTAAIFALWGVSMICGKRLRSLLVTRNVSRWRLFYVPKWYTPVTYVLVVVAVVYVFVSGLPSGVYAALVAAHIGLLAWLYLRWRRGQRLYKLNE